MKTKLTGPFRLLIDYGLEGMKFWEEDGYATVDDAVKEAVSACSGSKFLIVRVVNWQAVESNKSIVEVDRPEPLMSPDTISVPMFTKLKVAFAGYCNCEPIGGYLALGSRACKGCGIHGSALIQPPKRVRREDVKDGVIMVPSNWVVDPNTGDYLDHGTVETELRWQT